MIISWINKSLIYIFFVSLVYFKLPSSANPHSSQNRALVVLVLEVDEYGLHLVVLVESILTVDCGVDLWERNVTSSLLLLGETTGRGWRWRSAGRSRRRRRRSTGRASLRRSTGRASLRRSRVQGRT